MIIENEIIVLPIGFKSTGKLNIQDSKVKGIFNRKKTLKNKNAIRIRRLQENTTLNNCVIFLEGTMVIGREVTTIQPKSKYKSLVYVEEDFSSTRFITTDLNRNFNIM